MLIRYSCCKNYSLCSISVFDNDIAPLQEKWHDTKLLTFYRNWRTRMERDACFIIIRNTVVPLLSGKKVRSHTKVIHASIGSENSATRHLLCEGLTERNMNILTSVTISSQTRVIFQSQLTSYCVSHTDIIPKSRAMNSTNGTGKIMRTVCRKFSQNAQIWLRY